MDVDEPDTSAKNVPKMDETVDVDRFYLTRDNCEENKRAFIPRNAMNLKPIALELESLNKIKSDFISLDSYESNDHNHSKNIQKSKKHKKTPLLLYRELTVHKVQNNPNKIKKFKDKKFKKNKKH